MSQFHVPVMLDECVEFLQPRDGGVYVDATLGGGGHSLGLLTKNPNIRVYGFDQDENALAQAREKLAGFADRVEFIRANFSRMRTELALRRVKNIDGVIFDLGVSSHQLDTSERGFSFDGDAPLDMRMDSSLNYCAKDAVNELGKAELSRIFKEYGEELNAGRIAAKIVSQRVNKPLQSTSDLVKTIESVVGKGSRESLKSKARIFQALRIYVNRELEVLEPALRDAINLLSPGGRIAVLSYHSLEDRIVKNVFREARDGCVCPPEAMDCVCGKRKQVILICKKPLEAGEEEILNNIRSRSAKLRVAEKILGEK
ncbi:MAG: 16S rRNA (cytosine(1402)-N(4))-methyltransferase RsmH [Candidatus Cloacimonadaceae bacterium]|jgi:16S rRNA (cytosine1402-N4)-methyltransferase|nr:16S rRNA (cytosine(1402)-N(4))-methyltransferase RsmH [Candidatus Cloacimonadota bacterium]MDX9950349.1 16S rRNA (cytosine(1402)-N(4))-methyltransferase RsmH [Candidatus Syntrophosphaera sp.]NLN84509.1 16S rRNA (cytosine(1402)-N(4))-methyltransferase RsmH [Candidatus Cloacimonadota bacterium]